jgi:hypothetical protein
VLDTRVIQKVYQDKNYIKNAVSGDIFVRHDRRILRIRAYTETATPGSVHRDEMPVRHFSLTAYGTGSMQAIESIIQSSWEMYAAYKKRSVARNWTNNCWGFSGDKEIGRNPDSVIMAGNLMQEVIDEARSFLDNADWYAQRNIPHRRGYLLQGPPSTGKSSFVRALAWELRAQVYIAAPRAMSGTTLINSMSQIGRRAIVLFEDIDCAGIPTREPISAGTDLYSSGRSKSQTSENGATLSELLNALDGITTSEGYILIATTNHLDRIDPAFLRPGRIDRVIDFNLATPDQAAAMFRWFFRDLVADPKLQELANSFADSIEPDTVSPAQIQEYLLRHRFDPASAARGMQIDPTWGHNGAAHHVAPAHP